MPLPGGVEEVLFGIERFFNERHPMTHARPRAAIPVELCTDNDKLVNQVTNIDVQGMNIDVAVPTFDRGRADISGHRCQKLQRFSLDVNAHVGWGCGEVLLHAS